MARISYNDAIGMLTDAEKNRMVACYFAMANPNAAVDFDLAAKEYGSASVEAFKKGIFTALKKIEKQMENGDTPATPPSTKKPKPAARGRKRKAADDDDADYVSPKQTPKRARAKKVKYEEVASEDEAEVGDTAGDNPEKPAVEEPVVEESTVEEKTTVKEAPVAKDEPVVKEEPLSKEETQEA